MRRPAVLMGFLMTPVLSGLTFAQTERKIPASQAAQHIGERVSVCGYVASARFLSSSRSKPTFLNFDKPYPEQDFTVVIWPEDRTKFGEPENKYLHRNICVSGEITSYRGPPQIVANNAAQIKEQ